MRYVHLYICREIEFFSTTVYFSDNYSVLYDNYDNYSIKILYLLLRHVLLVVVVRQKEKYKKYLVQCHRNIHSPW